MINIKLIRDKERIRLGINKKLLKMGGKEPVPLKTINGSDVIFVHISKTGGTSIIEALKYKSKIHMTSREIINMLGAKKWEESFSFTFVRNPWDKVTSHYRYLIKTGYFLKHFGKLSFKDWVKRAYKNKDVEFYKQESPKMYYPQMDWITDFSGNVCINFIGRFENIEKDFTKLTNLLGISPKLRHLNRTNMSNTMSYKDYYDNETKIIIENAFLKDIEHFKYGF